MRSVCSVKVASGGSFSFTCRAQSVRVSGQPAHPRKHASSPVTCMLRKAMDKSGSSMSSGSRQAAYFDAQVGAIEKSITPKVDAKLGRIAQTIPGLDSNSRVLDVGCGTGAIISHLKNRHVRDVLGVDVSAEMISRLVAKFGEPPKLGNEPAVRSWLGDFMQLPAFYGPFDVVIFNAVFGNFEQPHATMAQACKFLRPGGRICISHPLGRSWLEAYRKREPDIVAHPLPDKETLESLIHDLPLRIELWIDDRDFYMAVLQVPERYTFPGAPIRLSGPVIHGFGRGSKQLGVPTANISAGDVPSFLPAGVYFGFARVHVPDDWQAADRATHKMVLNLGQRPTFRDPGEPEISVEANILHEFSGDFYDRSMDLVIVGFMRPETKFAGLPQLLAQIQSDIGIAKSVLDDPAFDAYRDGKGDHN